MSADDAAKSQSHEDVHDEKVTPLTLIKYTYSVGLLIFSVIIIMAAIFNEETKLSADVSPWLALVCFWGAIFWLTMIEGQQASLVGLPPVDFDLYKDSHPLTYKNTALAFTGDNLDRYLMGRQFMVLLVVFVINMCGSPNADADIFGLPDIVIQIFLGTGIAMILTTCMIGQLATQVNASHCMIDYINNYFALFTLYVAMIIEFTGIMHSSYLIQNVLAALSGKPVQSNEEPRNGAQMLFFWGRVLMSLAILGFALAVTFEALFAGNTTMWEGVPEAVSVILFVVLMSVVGMLEGMQIAFFAVAKIPASERGNSFFAKKTCDLLFKGNGQNLPGFMIGRQLTVVSCFFVVARVTTLDIEPGQGNNVFGIRDSSQAFLNTGLHAAVITTILASITWQLAASAFPLAFLANPATYILLIIALSLEATGVCSGAWVVARLVKKIMGLQYDEVYVGTPEERAANNHPDKTEEVGTGIGFHNMMQGVGSHDALDGPAVAADVEAN